jgi:hypothetical protein
MKGDLEHLRISKGGIGKLKIMEVENSRIIKIRIQQLSIHPTY